MVRAIAICVLLAGCGQPAATPALRGPSSAGTGRAVVPPEVRTPAFAAPVPGPRLADGVAPISYDVTLELDPDRASFTGHVAIAISVSQPGTTQVWLHAADLAIARATLRTHGHDEDVAMLASGDESQMRGFALPHPVGGAPVGGAPVGGETITLILDYTGRVNDLSGRTGKDEEGVFRERAGGRWYLYTQSESVFAREIVPCFDEPRFKPAWRVTAIVPGGLVALANAPVAAERALPGGRREVRFAEIASLPSYLFAVAVGPFDVVDAGGLGRAHTPVRLAVLAGDGKRVGRTVRELPKIVDAVERYLDAPLPLAKLDLVAVPRFFGAMENTGLITFDTAVLVDGRELVLVVAHELAHQWFGNSVTPAWWDHLWLSEAFATWLGERVDGSLGGARPPVLARRARAQALRADDQIDARPLVQPITRFDEVEPAFDAIAYEKGGAVLAMFERFAGASAFQAAVRAYVTAHARSSVTSQAFIDALARATSPAVGDALASYLVHAGTPAVELALACTAAPAIVASARGGVTIPVCVRFPSTPGSAETTRACFLAGAHTERPLPAAAGCPAWIAGNDGGRGYYRITWRGAAPLAPLAVLSPEERLARGDDAALAVQHGELPIGAALGELAALARTHDPYGELAALSIARAIDPFVADRARPAWMAWLAGWLADRLTPAALGTAKSPVDLVLRDEVVALAGPAIAPATLAALRAAGEPRRGGHDAMLQALAARDPDALFGRIAGAAAALESPDEQAELLEDLGAFPAAYAPRIVDVLLDRRFSGAQVWPALAAMLSRGETATAAWHAIHDRLAGILGALPGDVARDVIAATASLCDSAARAEVAGSLRAAATGGIDRTFDLTLALTLARTLDRALATIDRCIARRAAAGDVANALVAAPAPPAPPDRALTPRR